MMRAEGLVYGYMSKLSIDYSGGYWHYYTLDNGGFYMAPGTNEPFRLCWNGNGYEGIMTADAAGIVSTLFAINQLAAESPSDAIADLYYQVRDFAAKHPEARAILAAID